MPDNNPPEIFDRRRRAVMRDRAAQRDAQDDFLWQYMAEELHERLAMVSRDFSNVLMIGPIARYTAQILGDQNPHTTVAALSPAEAAGGAVILEEDRLPFARESFDLIISAGTLDSVNDLPGSLIQIRRSLRPDGLLLASLFGAGSLAALKKTMMRADGERALPHIHPQIDLRNAADLMSRAGFALPVADQDDLDVRYSDWRSLVDDLRDMGIGNVLAGGRHYLGKAYLGRMDEAWSALAEADQKITEKFVFLQLSGWAPSPDQPKPAKRGSGKVSLASVLSQKPDG